MEFVVEFGEDISIVNEDNLFEYIMELYLEIDPKSRSLVKIYELGKPVTVNLKLELIKEK
jgi:hypothetical protein